jgi:hypothetical protein
MFKGDLRVKYDNVKKRWSLMFPLSYVDKRGVEVAVPAGYSTDLDSVPRIPVAYAWLKGRATKSAVVHDWLYYNKYDRKKADKIFLNAMKDEGVAAWRRWPIYSAVRAFGWLAYK